MLVFRGMWRAGWVSLQSSPDRLAMRQQHFLSAQVLLLLPSPPAPPGSLARSSLGPQTFGVRECEPDGQEPKHETTFPKWAPPPEVSGHAQTPGGTGKQPCLLQEPKGLAQLFFLELRCNLHTLKLTILKYTIQWLSLICSQGCATIPMI